MLTLKEFFLSRKENLRNKLLSAKDDAPTFLSYIIEELRYILKPENEYMKSLTFSERKIATQLLNNYKNNYVVQLDYLNELFDEIKKLSKAENKISNTEKSSNSELSGLLIGTSSGTLSGILSGGALGGGIGAAVGAVIGWLLSAKENNSNKRKNSNSISKQGTDKSMINFALDETLINIEKYLTLIDNIIESKKEIRNETSSNDNVELPKEILRAVQSLISINYEEDSATPKSTSINIKNLITVLRANGIEVIKYEDIRELDLNVATLFEILETVNPNRTTIETISPAFRRNETILLKGRITTPNK